MINQECRRNDGRTHQMFPQLVKQPSPPPPIFDGNAFFFGDRGERARIHCKRAGNACAPLERVLKCQPRKRRRAMYFFAFNYECGRAFHVVEQGAYQLFRQFHEIFIVCIRPIKFHHGEFGIVCAINAFVAETAADLIYFFESSHDQALEVKLGSDAQKIVGIERMVMRDKWARRRPSRQRLQHGRLHFEKSPRVKKSAHCLRQADAHERDRARLFIDDQIKIALPETLLDVLEAVPFLRKRLERFRDNAQRGKPQRRLSRTSLKRRSGRFDKISDVERLGQAVVRRLPHPVLREGELQFPGTVLDVEKGGFPVRPEGAYAARDSRGFFFERIKRFQRVRDRMRARDFARIRIMAAGAQQFQTLKPGR